MNNPSTLIEVAQLGRLVGLKGELKLHLHCDFPEQFQKGRVFQTHKGESLEVFSYSASKGLISFIGYLDRDIASKLVNTLLYTTPENSMRDCPLSEGEFFWFDLINAQIRDEDVCLGVVDEIERIAVTDYLVVKTDESLVKQGLAKQFYIPYIDRYIIRFDKETRVVQTRDALGILENS